MRNRGTLGALAGAALLMFAVTSTAFAVGQPTYSIDVTKTANPPTVPALGQSVVWTVTVHNTGSGNLQSVNPVDDLVGCTLSAPSGPGAPDTLASGDTWTYTCTVAGVLPDTTNNVTVDACHDNGGCNNESHDAADSASFTVILGPGSSENPVGSENPGGSGEPDVSQAPTDTFGTAGSPSDGAWLLVVALGVLLGSLVVMTPIRSKRRS